MKTEKKLKPLPILRTDKEAEDFVDNANLAEYDLSGFKRTHFEFEKKSSTPLKHFRRLSRDYKLTVEWSDVDQAYIGYCHELFHGGVCDDENRIAAYAKLVEIVEWHLEDEALKNHD